MDPNNRIIVITGPAGTSKTFISCYAALKLLNSGDFENIYLTKPIVESGNSIGLLPGNEKEKTAPFLESFVSNFEDILDPAGSTNWAYLWNQQVIDFKIPQHARGANWKHCITIVDEIQNFPIKEMMTILTRLSNGSKFIFCGDSRQNDIDQRKVCVDFFKDKILEDVEGVVRFEFNAKDNMRDPILIKITENYDKYFNEIPKSR